MRLRRTVFALIAILGSIGFVRVESAFARGDLMLSSDQCVLKIGPDYIFFSGFQAAKVRKRFCEDVPEVGETVIAMDFGQDEMRGMNADVRIIRDTGATDEQAVLDSVTLLHLPSRTYPAGTISLKYDFQEAGNYAGLVTLDGPHGEHWVARFPFAVGRHYPARMPYYLLTAAVLLGLFVYFWGRDEGRFPGPKWR